MVPEKYRKRLEMACEATRKKFRQVAEDYADNPKLCKFCHSPLPYSKRNNKFCNHSCAASLTNAGQARSASGPRFCIVCRKKIKNRRYCSKRCMRVHAWERQKSQIEKTQEVIFGISERNNRRIVKKYLIETKGNICSVCHLSQWLGAPIPLVIDHVDGDCRNCKLANFRLVCGNCNMTLPTFAGRNIGKGKRSRRETVNGKLYAYAHDVTVA